MSEPGNSHRSIEGEDFGRATVWGVNFAGANFEDVNFTDATMSRVWLRNVSVDGFVEHLVVNGVDVTAVVNAGDPWWPLRGMLRPTDGDGHRAAWVALTSAWDAAIERAHRLGDDTMRVSVGGEWSFRDTLRHLVFVTDKWLFAPLAGATRFSSIGLSNTGSRDYPWPSVDRDANPDLGAVIGEYRARSQRVGEILETFDPASIPAEVEILENGTMPGAECFYAVFEEEFEHLRYATRDLAILEARAGS